MHIIKIFIASSEELRFERLIVSDIELTLNLLLRDKNIKIIMEKWEHLDSSMSTKHKQEEYNDALKECNICIALFWTRFGNYTKEEFDEANQACITGKTLKKVYAYFKEPTIEHTISKELGLFKQFCHDNAILAFNFQDDKTLKRLIITHIDAYCQEYLGIPIAHIENNTLMVKHKAF